MADTVLTPPPTTGTNGGQDPAGSTGLQFTDPALQGNASLARYKTLDEFGKGHLELEKKLGTRPLDVPAEGAPPETWSAFWKQHPDYPTSVEAYTAQLPQLPEGIGAIDEARLKSFRQGAHARGMTNKQLEYVQNFYAEELVIKPHLEATQQAEQTLARGEQATMLALKRQYGAGGAEAVVATAREYIRREFGNDAPFLGTLISKDGEARPLGNIPEFVHMAYQLGLSKGYNQYVQGDGASGMVSLEQAQSQLQAFQQQLLRKEITAQEYDAQVVRLQPLITAAREARARQEAMAGNRIEAR